MARRGWIIAGLLVGLALPAPGAERPAPPPSASEKELQAPLTLEDGKPTQAPGPEPGTSGLRDAAPGRATIATSSSTTAASLPKRCV